MNLTEEQIERHSRQIVLKEIGGISQEKMLNSKITLVGLGALGSPVVHYLIFAGIGSLKIIDYDSVEISNLHRQHLHFTEDLNRKKTRSALKKLNSLNSDCIINVVGEIITSENSKEILKNHDFGIECPDNVPTKMFINDSCIYLNIPFTIIGVLRFHSQNITVIPEEKTACYRCVFEGLTDGPTGMSCSEPGVIGLIPGVLGCLEAAEAIKYILNIGDLFTNNICYVDLLQTNFNFIDVYRDENCIACRTEVRDLTESYNYWIKEICQ